MKKSISQWSLPDPANLTDGLLIARAAGFEAVEPCMDAKGPVSLESTRSDVESILDQIRTAGLEVSSVATGVLWQTPLSASDPDTRTEAKRRLHKLIEVATWFETDAILVIPGAVDVCFVPNAEVVPYDVVYERSRESIQEVLPAAEEAGVTICIENVWNSFLLTPLEMRDYVDSFESRFVKAYFDVGNVIRFGYPEQWIRILKDRIKRVHLKDFRRAAGGLEGFVDLLAGDVNWPAVMKAFRDVGYDGYLTAEMGRYRYYPEAVLFNTSTAMDFILAKR
jgi:hexulose-6-phosphate isomerase